MENEHQPLTSIIIGKFGTKQSLEAKLRRAIIDYDDQVKIIVKCTKLKPIARINLYKVTNTELGCDSKDACFRVLENNGAKRLPLETCLYYCHEIMMAHGSIEGVLLFYTEPFAYKGTTYSSVVVLEDEDGISLFCLKTDEGMLAYVYTLVYTI